MAEHKMSTRIVIPRPCHGQACGEEAEGDDCQWTQHYSVSAITTWWSDLCWCRLEWSMGTKTTVDGEAAQLPDGGLQRCFVCISAGWKSTSGVAVYVAGAIVAWMTSSQPFVTQSTA